jgi:hypothetical protein
MFRLFIGLTIILSVACEAPAQPAEVIVIRHAEKPPDGNELSLPGQEWAAALAPYFLKTTELLELETPVAIYAQSPKHETSSLRPIETVKPLADALILTINEACTRDQFREMFAEVMENAHYNGHPVLICWEHKAIPKMAKEFGRGRRPGGVRARATRQA